MSELQVIKHLNASEKIDLQTFSLPQNYSILINKLEQLALGLDSAFSNPSLDRKEVDIAISDSSARAEQILDAPPLLGAEHVRTHGEVQFSRVVSDIWIGVILTLLIMSVIFFICSCFLYHKFQQWKNSYRTSHNEGIEICRRCPVDFEAESLPSYTIVSGLPTYDDALEEFRKAGIVLTSPTPVIRLFEGDTKSGNIFNIEETLNTSVVNGSSTVSDNISSSSTCCCDVSGAEHLPNQSIQSIRNSIDNSATQIIELSPEQLATLSQKRLSLQIAFNTSIRSNSRPRIDLYRTANRNNHLRSRALSNTGLETPPPLQRSSSTVSLAVERTRMQQHRGSLS